MLTAFIPGEFSNAYIEIFFKSILVLFVLLGSTSFPVASHAQDGLTDALDDLSDIETDPTTDSQNDSGPSTTPFGPLRLAPAQPKPSS